MKIKLNNIKNRKYYGNEDEKRGEKVSKIGHKVCIIVKDYSLPGGMISGKLRHVLIEVEDYAYWYDKRYGIKICANKLLDDVPIEKFDVLEKINVAPFYLFQLWY